MTATLGWVGTPQAAAVGWTLIHSIWQGAIIAAALVAILISVRSPRVRYAAACAALFALFAACALTLDRAIPAVRPGAAGHDFRAFWSRQAPPPGVSASTGTLRMEALAPWLAEVWIIGVFVLCFWRATGFIAVRRWRSRGVCPPPDAWREKLANLAAELRVSRPVLLMESFLAETPAVLGHLRPLILMPAGLLTSLPAEQIEAILLHELAHIRRCDYLINILQRAAECLFFYHPAVWWISAVMRAERENCCDDVVVMARGNPRQYAAALAALEQFRWRAAEPALAATGGNLVKRIRRLLSPNSPNYALTPLVSAVILAISGTVAVFAWQTDQLPRAPSGVQAGIADSSPWMKWLNEDVVYIITDAERADYLKLTTNIERANFIEQFWLRRDPTPGTPENEMKEEHYRRISYANLHFATSGNVGWRTDRGRFYITFGPPDEIESRLSSAQERSAREIWMYRYIEGVGDNQTATFVDLIGSGDYRLAPGNGR